MMKRSWLVWALALLPVLPATAARAYVHTLTCREGADPAEDPMACRDGQEPVPIFWNRDCAVYHIHEGGCADTENEATILAIRESFDAWNEPACSYLELIDGGLTDEDRVGYYSCDSRLNANIVIFRPENWSHQRAALALTSVTFNSASGEIVDSDIEFNDQWFTFSTTDTQGLVRNDIRNTLTHEVGHFLGLDHSDDEEATMFLRAPMGELDKRSLEQDDIDGLCSIYPAAEARGSCDTSLAGFFSKPEEAPGDACPQDPGNCDCSMSPTQRRPALFAILLGLSVLCVWRRRSSPKKS